ADGDKVRPVFESVREGLATINGPRGQHLEGDPGLGDRFHEGDGLLRIDAPHVVIPAFAPVEPNELFAQGLWRRRRVIVAVESLDVEVTRNMVLLTSHGDQ